MGADRWTVRQVSIDADLAELYEVEAQVTATSPHVLDTGGPSAFREFLARGGTPLAFLWADSSGEPVGYLSLLDEDGADELEIRSIAVIPRMQGSGLGSEMMMRAERVARGLARRRLALATSPENEGAIRFYARHGFGLERVENDHFGDGTARQILSKRLPEAAR